MNAILIKALVALVPVCLLFVGSLVLLSGVRSAWCVLQVIGAGGFVVVIVAHICEGLHLLPWMGWGLENSLGHYIDLSSAVVAFTLFPAGYLIHAVAMRR